MYEAFSNTTCSPRTGTLSARSLLYVFRPMQPVCFSISHIGCWRAMMGPWLRRHVTPARRCRGGRTTCHHDWWGGTELWRGGWTGLRESLPVSDPDDDGDSSRGATAWGETEERERRSGGGGQRERMRSRGDDTAHAIPSQRREHRQLGQHAQTLTAEARRRDDAPGREPGRAERTRHSPLEYPLWDCLACISHA
jgi:hypothetical protein